MVLPGINRHGRKPHTPLTRVLKIVKGPTISFPGSDLHCSFCHLPITADSQFTSENVMSIRQCHYFYSPPWAPQLGSKKNQVSEGALKTMQELISYYSPLWLSCHQQHRLHCFALNRILCSHTVYQFTALFLLQCIYYNLTHCTFN